jgi:hypothetical protein
VEEENRIAGTKFIEMIEIPREVLKADKVFGKLLQVVVNNHKVAYHTQKVLTDNKHVKDFCEEARHFSIVNGIYIHYDTSSWFKTPNGVIMKVERIGIYDDFMEYEKARVKSLHSAGSADIPNIN